MLGLEDLTATQVDNPDAPHGCYLGMVDGVKELHFNPDGDRNSASSNLHDAICEGVFGRVARRAQRW